MDSNFALAKRKPIQVKLADELYAAFKGEGPAVKNEMKHTRWLKPTRLLLI